MLICNDLLLIVKVVERVMAGAGRRLLSGIPGKMNYLDFVIFLISEVDKNNDVALDYWFNVIDIDADGIITTFEIEYFFEESVMHGKWRRRTRTGRIVLITLCFSSHR